MRWSGQECIPLIRPQNKTQWDIIDKNIPGWKEHVEPYRNSSVWMSAGRPVNSELHNVLSWSKNQYHNSVRRVKNLADTIRSSKLSDAALSGNKQLFQDWKKSNLLTIKQLQNNVDAASGIYSENQKTLELKDDFKTKVITLKARLAWNTVILQR